MQILTVLCVTAGEIRINNIYNDEIASSVVQIYAIQSNPYYLNPWITLPQKRNIGAGIIIKGKKILTNAHVIANQTYISVKKSLGSSQHKARVLYVAHEADLALLTVDDDDFYSDVIPLETGNLPALDEKVLLYGFPGSETLTITDGVFSGIRHREYTHSSHFLLAGEIHSEVSFGSSGGPVIYNDRVAGLIMQANRSGTIAHMIPAAVIDHFLKDVEDGVYNGFPDIGLITRQPEKPDMKDADDRPGSITGVTVSHVISGSPGEGYIMKDDIILSINGYNIMDNGTIEFMPNLYTDYRYSFEMRQISDPISLEIMHLGIRKKLSLPLTKVKKDFQLIPGEQYDRNPRYFIFGGIIFSPLTKNIFNEWASPPQELLRELSGWPTMDRKELVVALLVLPADVNRDYHGLHSRLIEEVNGRKIRDFDSLLDAVINSDDQYIIFKDTLGNDIIINRMQAMESHQQILETYNIKNDRSPDLIPLHAGRYPSSNTFQ